MAVCIVLAPEQARQHLIGKRANFFPLEGTSHERQHCMFNRRFPIFLLACHFKDLKKSLLGRIESCVSEKNAARERWMVSPI